MILSKLYPGMAPLGRRGQAHPPRVKEVLSKQERKAAGRWAERAAKKPPLGSNVPDLPQAQDQMVAKANIYAILSYNDIHALFSRRRVMPSEARVSVGKNGRLVIPMALRKAAGLAEGGEAIVRLREGRIEIEPLHLALERARRTVREYAGDRRLAEELIRERRKEAEHE